MACILCLLGFYIDQFSEVEEVVEVEVNGVVVSGECYTYILGSWVAPDCFDTKKAATVAMDSHIAYSNKSKAHENRDWVPVDKGE